MLSKTLRDIAVTKAKVARLERAIAEEMRAELSDLPSRYGFENVAAFAKALRAAAVGRRRRGRPRTKAARPKKRKRAIITDATRDQVKRLLEAGTSVAAITEFLAISAQSVHNIKKALGLVKARK